jgi:ribosomal protein S20
MNLSKFSGGDSPSGLPELSFFSLWSLSISLFKSATSWLTPKQMDYPDNESGELLRRAMIPQSWFDRLSAQWEEQPMEVKLSVFSGVVFFFGFIGIFSGVAALLSLSALASFIGIHSALVSHQLQRIKHAQKMVKETGKLIDDLEECKHDVEASADQINNLINIELRPQSEDIKHCAQDINCQSDALHETTAQIEKETLTHSVQALAIEQEEVIAEFKKAQEYVQQVDKAAEITLLHTNKMKQSTARFNQSVNKIQKSQQEYSELTEEIQSFEIELDAQDALLKNVLSFSCDSHNNESTTIDECGEIQNGLGEHVALRAAELNAFQIVLDQQQMQLGSEREALVIINQRTTQNVALRAEKRKRFDEASIAWDDLLNLEEQDLDALDERIEKRKKKKIAFNEVLSARKEQSNSDEAFLDARISIRAEKRKVFDRVLKVHEKQEQRDKNLFNFLGERINSHSPSNRFFNEALRADAKSDTSYSEEVKENNVYRFYQPESQSVADEIAENELFIARLRDEHVL